MTRSSNAIQTKCGTRTITINKCGTEHNTSAWIRIGVPIIAAIVLNGSNGSNEMNGMLCGGGTHTPMGLY